MRYPASRTFDAHASEQHHGIGVFPLRIAVGKVSAEIAQRGRSEQRVGDRMRQDVGVGVSERTAFERNLDAAENQTPSFDQPVRVEPVPETRHARALALSSRPA